MASCDCTKCIHDVMNYVYKILRTQETLCQQDTLLLVELQTYAWKIIVQCVCGCMSVHVYIMLCCECGKENMHVSVVVGGFI